MVGRQQHVDLRSPVLHDARRPPLKRQDRGDGQREAVTLFYLAGLTYAEAAEYLGVPPGAVKTRLHKARANLRRSLQPLWKERQPMPTPIEMRMVDVRRAGDRHMLVLAEDGGERELKMFVGPAEAVAIAALLEGVELPRPGSHQL